MTTADDAPTSYANWKHSPEFRKAETVVRSDVTGAGLFDATRVAAAAANLNGTWVPIVGSVQADKDGVSLSVANPATRTTTELHVPDTSAQPFRSYLQTRQAPEDLPEVEALDGKAAADTIMQLFDLLSNSDSSSDGSASSKPIPEDTVFRNATKIQTYLGYASTLYTLQGEASKAADLVKAVFEAPKAVTQQTEVTMSERSRNWPSRRGSALRFRSSP